MADRKTIEEVKKMMEEYSEFIIEGKTEGDRQARALASIATTLIAISYELAALRESIDKSR